MENTKPKHEKNRSIPKEFTGISPVNVGPDIAKKLPKSDGTYNNQYLTGNYKNSFFLEHITKYELEVEIKNLSSKKSLGYDSLSVKVIQSVTNVISEPLTYFQFNFC